jgi:hypothetical protein
LIARKVRAVIPRDTAIGLLNAGVQKPVPGSGDLWEQLIV